VPTEIQKKQPLLLENKTDLVGLAKNRNWKTAAFDCLFTINRYKHTNVQAVILVPTRIRAPNFLLI
jgi:ATP-dependent RNA helicase DeaD